MIHFFKRRNGPAKLPRPHTKNFGAGAGGITAIELLISVAVILVLFVFIVGLFKKLNENQVLDSAFGNVVSTIKKARSLTLSSKNNLAYGVHFEAGSIVLFNGVLYNPGSSDNETLNLDAKVFISNLSLNGGGSEIIFQKFTGNTGQNGTIQLSLKSDANKKKIITVYPTGIIEDN